MHLKVVFLYKILHFQIKDYTFSRCSKLQNVIIPENLVIINQFSFHYCTSLNNIIIPKTVVHIRRYAFYYCTNITNFSIPEKVFTINECTFCGCQRLRNINISNSITYIDHNAYSQTFVESIIQIEVNRNKTISKGTPIGIVCGSAAIFFLILFISISIY